MNKTMKRVMTFGLVAMLAFSVAGCGNKTAVKVKNEDYGDTYPIDTDVTLTWWTNIDDNTSSFADNLGKTEFAKVVEEKTGIKIKFIHPSASGGDEQFNLMLAGGDMPDIIDSYWLDFAGGAEKAISDGYIIPLNDMIDGYAPNLKKKIESNEEYDIYLKTDSGDIFAVPCFTPISTAGGPMLRKDWLDDLGLEVPETMDEWTTVLRAFKEQKGAKAPLSINTYSMRIGAFSGAYNIQLDWYADGGQVKYGFYEDAYKDFLTQLNAWYKEGLFDNNFSVNDQKIIDANMLSGVTGATFGGLTSGIGKYMQSKKSSGEAYQLTPAPYPTSEKGKIPEFGQYSSEVSGLRAAISTNCKYPELAMRLLDWFYSEDGIELVNWGVEGKSFEVKDGKKVFTDDMLNPPEGKTVAQQLCNWTRPYVWATSVYDIEAYKQTLLGDEMKLSFDVWKNQNGRAHTLPPLYPTEEEKSRVAELSNAISTYTEEMFIKFVSGLEPLENFSNYKAELEKMGIKELSSIKQAAYERALNR